MKSIVLITFLSVLSFSCSKIEAPTSTPITPVVTKADFPFDLYKMSSAQKPSDNVIISPLSMEMALKMVINGANGVTKDEMKMGLRTTQSIEEINTEAKSKIEKFNSSDQKVDVNLANSIWVQEGFPLKESFTNSLSNNFYAESFSKPFTQSTTDELNSWVSKQTKGKIKKLIDKLSGDDVAVLINTLYFKADWMSKFEKNLTSKEKFNMLDGSSRQVDMMKMTSAQFSFYQDDELQAVSMPFASGNFEMVAILPSKDKDFHLIEQSLSLQRFEDIISNMEGKYLDLSMPKFKIEYENSYKGILFDMGMKSLFSISDCNLSQMTDVSNIFISEVIQKVFFECQESGVEAAAATAAVASTTSMPPPGVPVVFDRSFIIVLREKESNSILFLGKVVSP